MKYKTLYHASPIRNRNSILKDGILPYSKNGRKIQYKKRLFLFEDFRKPPLDFVGYNDIDIWEVKVDLSTIIKKDLIAEKDGHKRSFYIKNKISPDKIKLKLTIAW